MDPFEIGQIPGSASPGSDINAGENNATKGEQGSEKDSPGTPPAKSGPLSKEDKEKARKERIEKRVNTVLSDRNKYRDENEQLKTEIAELKGMVKSIEAGPKKPSLTDRDLEKAAQKFIDDGDAKGMMELTGYMVAEAVNKERDKTKKENEEALNKQAKDQGIQNALIEAYPDLQDRKSELRQIANEIYEKRPDLKAQGWTGYYHAATLANNILIEEGSLQASKTKRKRDKKAVEESLIDDSIRDEGDEELDTNAVDRYFEQRRKLKSRLTNIAVLPKS